MQSRGRAGRAVLEGDNDLVSASQQSYARVLRCTGRHTLTVRGNVMDTDSRPGRSRRGTLCSTAARCALLLSLAAIGGCGGGSAGPSAPSSPPPAPPASPPPPSPPVSHDADVRWFAPTTRLDGSPIDNLIGYRVYYGTSYLNLPHTRIEISNPSAVTWKVTDLSSGTWYFAVTAFDASGYESSFSNIVSLTFP